jgi:hypothetical protein
MPGNYGKRRSATIILTVLSGNNIPVDKRDKLLAKKNYY